MHIWKYKTYIKNSNTDSKMAQTNLIFTIEASSNILFECWKYVSWSFAAIHAEYFCMCQTHLIRFRVKSEVVIPTDDHFVAVRQPRNKIRELLHFPRSASAGEISCVKKDVSIRHRAHENIRSYISKKRPFPVWNAQKKHYSKQVWA